MLRKIKLSELKAGDLVIEQIYGIITLILDVKLDNNESVVVTYVQSLNNVESNEENKVRECVRRLYTDFGILLRDGNVKI